MSEEQFEVFSLGSKPSCPCIILYLEGLTVMLDCSLDISTFLHFMPLLLTTSDSELPIWTPGGSCQINGNEHFRENSSIRQIFIESNLEAHPPLLNMVDPSTIDVVLLSNYNNMLALPFLVRNQSFQGRVYATEPTVAIAKQYMEDLLYTLDRLPKKEMKQWKQVRDNKLAEQGIAFNEILRWRTLYSQEDVIETLKRIKTVGLNEIVDLFGQFRATPVSSGYCLGSCNWILEDEFRKFSYVSSTSVLKTSFLPLDKKALQSCDVMILNCLNSVIDSNPDHMLIEFGKELIRTLSQSGNVLIPCYPSGIVYDLLECVHTALETKSINVPIYFLSSVGNASLAYANICSEWLCSTKQTKVFLPENPFPHADYLKSGRLKHFPSIYGDLGECFQTPCVIFTGHPTLRCGDVVHFINLWKSNSKNSIIFIEPEIDYQHALGPYQPVQMHVCYFPIDPILMYSRANSLLNDLAPSNLVLPKEYTNKHNQISPGSYQIWPYTQTNPVKINMTSSFKQIKLSHELAAQISPLTISPGIMVSSISGVLRNKDGEYVLTPREFPNCTAKSCQCFIFGDPKIEHFIEKLKTRGFNDVQVVKKGTVNCVTFANGKARVEFSPNSTLVITQNEDQYRYTIKDVLMQHFTVY